MPGSTSEVTTLFFTSTVITLLLVVCLVLFVVVYQRKLLAQQSRLKAAEHRYQIDLLKSSIATQEEERSRIAKDLHDDIGVTLLAVKLHLQQFARKVPHDSLYQEFVDEARKLLDDSIHNVRSVAANLMPSSLEKWGLIPALKDLIQTISQTSGPDIQLQFQGEELSGLSRETAVALYRMVKELLTNSLKHAGAQIIRIVLKQSSDGLLLQYSDDGKGFDSQRKYKGAGLRNIRSRVLMMNGEVRFDSTPGEGLDVWIHIPVSNHIPV